MTNRKSLPSLPSLPSLGRKARPVHPCICGCGAGTRGMWAPGHDGRATGWAVRIERGIITIDEVPDNERNGARVMLERRERERKAEATA